MFTFFQIILSHEFISVQVSVTGAILHAITSCRNETQSFFIIITNPQGVY